MLGILLSIAILIALAVSLIIVPILKYRITLFLASRRRPCAPPPRTPSKDPILNLDSVAANLRIRKEKKWMKKHMEDFARYGRTHEAYPFGNREITTCDPRNVQFFLSTEADKFGNAPTREAMIPLIGKGIMNQDGAAWKKSRGLTMPTFTRSHIADREFFDKHFERFLARLPGDGRTVDLKPLFEHLSLDAASEFIFGESFDSQLGDESSLEADKFIVAFQDAQLVVGFKIGLGRLSFLMRDEKVKKFKENCQLVREHTARYVEKALERQAKTTDGKEEKGSYILAHEIAKLTTDKDALSDELLNVFFAGRDTPAVALGNIFFCLSRHPEVWRKIREDVQGLRAEDLSFEKLKSLQHLQNAIKEALRLLPMVPVTGRTSFAETALPYGGGPDGSMPVCLVPGDMVKFNIYAMHRDPSVFGPDVEAYRPERWEGGLRPYWNYMPFSAGARHCPGQQLASFWLSYTIARLAMEFREVQNKDPVYEYVENLRLNMESANGVQVALIR